MKYLIRLICLPFWFMVGFIHLLYVLTQRSILFMKHGGECITYLPEDRKMIHDIYNELKNNKI